MQLVVIEPDGKQFRIELTGSEHFIGRDPSLPVVLRHPKVSRKHARLFSRGGRFWIEDLSSSNGVKVNGVSISGPTALDVTSAIEIGGFRLALVPSEAEAAASERLILMGRSAVVTGREYPLAPGQVAVGRGADNIVVIDDPSISRHHAVLVVQGAEVAVEDLQSSNGTFVNGKRVARHVLQPGDDVRFGNIAFSFIDRGRGSLPSGGLLRFATSMTGVTVMLGVVCVVLLFFVGQQLIKRGGNRSEPTRRLGAKERTYEQQVASNLGQAQTQMKNQSWANAARAFASVLALDPINVEARAGLANAESNRDQEALVGQATQAIEQNQPVRALVRVANIGPQAFYSNAADALADKARNIIAHNNLANANRSCKRGEWRDCHEAAAIMLTYVPQSVVAQALVEESEDAMRTRHIAFTAWTNNAGSRLARLYADSDVRELVLRYAAGDQETALKRLPHMQRKRGAANALNQINAFRRYKTAGDGAAAADINRALKAWEQALKADAALVEDGPSAFGSELRSRVAGELLRLGNTAFERGVYADAFNDWNRGIQLDGQHVELNAALGKLENRATLLLNDIPNLPQPDDTACGRLRQVTAMTRPESQPNRLARERLARCKQASPP